MLESGGGAVVGHLVDDGPHRRAAASSPTAPPRPALSHWTRLAAQDLAPRIRVNAIAVGSIATSALEIVLEDDEPAHRDGAGHARSSGSATPRRSRPRCSSSPPPPGGYVTGKVVEVDGGIEQPNLDMGLPDL